MVWLLLGLVVFLGVHSTRVFADDWRTRMVARIGEKPWKGLYSVLSVAGFVLLVWGYGQARQEPVVVWTPPRGMSHLAALLTVPAFIFLVAAYVPRNGIRARLRHPMTMGVKTWALAHLLVNGSLADLMLFGTFLIWAVLVFRSARRRPVAATAASSSSLTTALTVLVGTGVWALFLWGGLHARWIGVSPLGSMGA